MNTIIGELGKNSKFCEYIKNIENKKSPIVISGLTDVGISHIISATKEFAKKPICIITYNEIQAKRLVEDLKYFTDKVIFLPKKEIVTYDYIAESKDLPYERIEALNKIQESKINIVVTTIEAVMQKMISKKELYKNILKFKIGDQYNLEELKQKLVDLGYVRYDLIDGRGQFSIRGGIVDISITEKTGIRIEFWGDEIDSIRYFNVISQRSTENIDKITIYPAHEYLLETNIENVINEIKNAIYDETIQAQVEQDIETIKTGNYISKIDRYLNAFYNEQETILDYINDKYIIVLDEINKIEQRLENVNKDSQNIIQLLIEKEKIAPDTLKNLLNYEQFEEKIEKKQIIYVEKFDDEIKVQAEKYKWFYKEKKFYKSEIEILFKELLKAQEEKKKIYILAETKEKAKKICSLLNEKEIINKYEEKLNQTIIVKNNESLVTVSVGKLSSGFECFDLNELVIDGGSGEIKIEDIIADRLELDLGAGLIEIASSTFYKADIDGGVGVIDAIDTTLSSLELDAGVGSVSIDGEILGRSTIDGGIGEINLNLSNESLYKFIVDKGLGDITVNGTSISGTYGNGENVIDIDNGIGSVNITFD